ncbi:hypothetical protein [Pseudonocardia xishanensis]|uniref:Uncharacterized protein n=1 Tax=Pseudonocardia xishanensis TaxID=630995 RepID=A0ABP8RSC1_9PSEU
MVQLCLTDDEAEALHDLLDTELGRLSMEIAGTDNPRYRAILRERRQALTSARAALSTRTATQPS